MNNTKWWHLTEENIILDENNKRINTHKVEKLEQELAGKFIEENDRVLELGARYGSVSVVINKKLKNKDKHLAVEPDCRVWDALEKNKKGNDCHFNILKGFVSKVKLGLENHDAHQGYGTNSKPDPQSDIQSYSLEEFKDYDFNVLVADIEGGLERFLEENTEFMKNLRLVMFEADQPHLCNYKKIKEFLRVNNYKQLLNGFQNVFVKNV